MRTAGKSEQAMPFTSTVTGEYGVIGFFPRRDQEEFTPGSSRGGLGGKGGACSDAADAWKQPLQEFTRGSDECILLRMVFMSISRETCVVQGSRYAVVTPVMVIL